ncbi:MAG: hypothetical protein N5P05_001496 [Chroococcopsis gigantea SAG 12.99]|jgi:hypothetical protein|nr:hypothetical protein [Chlorogloea purpurea SAG 13.99]MDV2999890.1 hypothetical protein [Chroococcopsis gigantea SAG 12.99]
MSIEKCSDIFGDITVYPPKNGKQRVEIYIRLQEKVEGMQTGIGIDGSASMRKIFGDTIPKFLRKPEDNVMQKVIRRLCSYACEYSGDGMVLPIYWATGAGGKEVETLGRLDTVAIESKNFEGPKKWGTGTALLPPLEYFLTELKDAPWLVLLFVTDGVIGDLEAVIQFSLKVGQEMLEGKRGKCKFILVGCGEEVDEEQIEKLDNMFDGTPLEGKIDLWDGKLASQMENLSEIWDEVDFGVEIPGSIRIIDDSNREVLSCLDGFPQRLEFSVTEGTKSVKIDIVGNTFEQILQ